jgi:hypothetical protein
LHLHFIDVDPFVFEETFTHRDHHGKLKEAATGRGDRNSLRGKGRRIAK